jgi:hypothetical protein
MSYFIPPSTVEALGLLPTGSGDFGTTLLPRTINIPGDGGTGPYSLGLVPMPNSLTVHIGPLKADPGTHYTVLGNQLWTSSPTVTGETTTSQFIA